MNNPRWKCPECGGTDIRIALPAWHTESKDGTLTYIQTDAEASVMWWLCNECEAFGDGNPDEA